MELNLRVLVICLFYLVAVETKIKLKALWNLEGMSICRLRYSAIVYVNYGCWCGMGGSGKPIDGIDRAVENGLCYDTAEEYVLPYDWMCNGTKPLCLTNGVSECSKALCDCDSRVVKCWNRFDRPVIRAKCMQKYGKNNNNHSRPSSHYSSILDKLLNMLKRFISNPK
ncbi:unnamed protein product [Thelazia callipaeda]|uniref:Phospholipase A2 n=1 Tax=Thelazia callipaeda TaxID=103827 RepID=A0A0N5CNF2_THECL|nr:unnamed protein product [Thelazia callipaeda]